MTGNEPPPDYDLADRIALTEPAQVKAISHPLRTTILGLLHERAATVSELAVALERPKSTVAHHVKVLKEAGLVRAVRTRRVRAIEERFYGRTARMFYVGVERSPDGDQMPQMQGVPGVPQLVGERPHSFGQPLDVVVQHDLRHRRPSSAIDPLSWNILRC